MPADDVADDALPVAEPVRRPEGPRRPPSTRYIRVTLLTIGLLLAGLFAVAGYLNPYEPDGTPRQMATHTQLGLPQCNFVAMSGKPCPSCGMTTSFALLVRGDMRGSLNANWVGTMLALFWAGRLVWSLASALAGRPLLIPPGRGELALTVAVGFFLVLMLGRWGAILLKG
jgi:hypothetical protein